MMRHTEGRATAASTVPPPRRGDEASAALAAAGLVALASAAWPQPGVPAIPSLPGFIESPFSPLVAHVADLCLRALGDPPLPARLGTRTALVIASLDGDAPTATGLARAVDGGSRVAPLLFFQSVPNAVAGHISARWGLGGPVVCISPVDAPLVDALACTALLLADGDADAALVITADVTDETSTPDRATALLVVTTGRASATKELLDVD
jgi:hypothetical protein